MRSVAQPVVCGLAIGVALLGGCGGSHPPASPAPEAAPTP
jgi:hypothetical protein